MTNMYKIFLVSLFILMVSWVYGQERTVSGTVTDQNGESLPGVTIREVTTTNGVITDIDGKYILTVSSADAVLGFSFIGFASQEIVVGDRTTIDVSLSEAVGELEEVVVIGYGTQKKKVVTGAIESVSSDEISSTPIVRVDQALQGRAAGVNLTNSSGQPGEQPNIIIRGIGTNGNAQPLFLVDGIAVQSIDNLNPADIESMEVLKDASSTAIYGTRAANGIVLITTKKGQRGGVNVTYSGYKGIQSVSKKVDMLNAQQYQTLMAEAGVLNLAREPFDPNEIPANDTDWQEELFTNNAPIESHSISISGGSEKSTFLSSVSYFNQEGIIGGDKSKFERYTARLNTQSEVNAWLSWGNNFNFSNVKTRGVNSNGSFNGAYNSALNMDPLTAVFENDPSVLTDPTDDYAGNPVVTDSRGNVYAISNNIGQEIVNPLARLEILNFRFNKDQFVGNVYAKVEPIEGLSFKSDFGMDLSYLKFDDYTDLYFLSSTTNNLNNTNLSKQFIRSLTLQVENTVSYTRKIDDHNFNVLLGTSAVKNDSELLSGFGEGVTVTNPDLRYLSLAIDSLERTSGAAWQNRLSSVFTRLMYDYKEKYSATLTYRKDGSSQFGPNNRYGNFMSFGASWFISDEAFFPQWDEITFVKLRGGWGVNGNDKISPFAYVSTIDFDINYSFGGGATRGAIPTNIQNENIQWEESQQLNFGLDAGLFSNRLTATFDYYNKTTKKLLLVPSSIPASAGLNPSFNNVGEVENKGVEMSLEWRDRKGDFNYSIGVNAAYNKNTMTQIDGEGSFLTGSSWALAGEVTRTFQGNPIYTFFGYKTDGIFQSQADVFSHISSDGTPIQPSAQPGDIRFVDVNGDGRITADDRTIIGSPNPDWVVGSTINVGYKNFDLSILLNGLLGQDIFNGINRPDLPASNKQSWILDRWTESNPSTTVPRFVANDVNGNYTRPTDLVNIKDGSFIRMKNIQIGYNFPGSVLERFKCTSWRLYISAENLFTFTSYDGPDPEVGARVFDGNPVLSDRGIDRGIYPQARTFRIGTSITF
ncbi:TonB-linked outer membrane protein, SusC/RagA family [Ekhidna lutea]|uniref:TonB-linked outer membrane protein, SusC/RagA family n=2 Tax=Ekhidna lutea TaxID=447679 RepID=A0A239LWC2_EKHLU|nr:TonB-linked outer membrane protein, SusC/RagA family [Ekhidna lutea]